MQELLTKRYADWHIFIEPDLLQEIILDCGGDLRDYLRAIKILLMEMEADPAIERSDLLDIVRGQIRPPREAVPSAHIAWMARLERSHDPEINHTVNSRQFHHYLATKHVQAYLNGDNWYAVHPLLRDWVLARPEAQAQP